MDYITEDAPDPLVARALHRLSLCLAKHYKKKVLIFMDEYDTPLQEAYINGYWNELTEFLRGIFNSAFKTNPYMERGILTGITRISKESIFSDLNNLEIVTTSSRKYETAFGFTQAEVEKILTLRKIMYSFAQAQRLDISTQMVWIIPLQTVQKVLFGAMIMWCWLWAPEQTVF